MQVEITQKETQIVNNKGEKVKVITFFGKINGQVFPIGKKVTYKGNIGLANGQSLLDPNFVYSREKYRPKFGFWADFIQPTVNCESAGSYYCLNTYDRARFTFGFLQYAAHVYKGDFIKYFRKILTLPEASSYFPDLILVNDEICQKIGGTTKSLEKNDNAELLNYLNPTLTAIEQSELKNSAKFIHWIRNHSNHQEMAVEVGVNHVKEALRTYGGKYNLNGRLDKVCLVIFDIRHQGRGGNEASALIKQALANTDEEKAYQELLKIGSKSHPERINTLSKSITTLVSEGILGKKKYDSAQNDFVNLTTPIVSNFPKFKVNVDGLWIRKMPTTKKETELHILPYGQEVLKLSESSFEDWWKIKTTLDGQELEGFSRSVKDGKKYLIESNQFVPKNAVSKIKEVNLTDEKATRNNPSLYLCRFALNEPNQPQRTGNSKETKNLQIHEIINWLTVEKSKRYLPRDGMTFCNIYAYDFCYLAKVFIPRVWWTPEALDKLATGKNVTAIYGQTVSELNANALALWFEKFGNNFGWNKTQKLTDIQNAANDGKIGIIVGKNSIKGGHGHIQIVVPETDQHRADWNDQHTQVELPLCSQAGASNFRYGSIGKWWQQSKYTNIGFYIHD